MTSDVDLEEQSLQPPVFSYTLDSQKGSLIIPSLDDIVNNSPESSSTPYNRVNFVKFLSLSHCLENFESVVELDYLRHPECTEEERVVRWQVIYRTFLMEDSPKEINIPHHIKVNFHQEQIPTHEHLLELRCAIYDLLLDSYNGFIKYTKASNIHNANSYRRKSEIVAPDFNEKRGVIPRSTSQYEPTVSAGSGDNSGPSTRNNSTTLTSSSRGSSAGSLFESFKNHDYVSWKKTVKKFRFRRSLGDSDLQSNIESDNST